MMDIGSKQIKCIDNKCRYAIVAGCSESYLRFLDVTLVSILDNRQSDFFCDFIIFVSEHSEEEKILQGDISGYSNASLRFFVLDDIMPHSDNYCLEHGSLESFYKMISPFFLDDYEKVLCLDVDLVFKNDVARIFQTATTDYVLAAVRDVDSMGLYNGGLPFKKDYFNKVLGIKNPYDYFQAGVVLYDLDNWRQQNLNIEEVLDFCASKKWELMDQDVMNVLYEGRATYLDYKWNVLTDCGGYRIKKYISRAPEEYQRMYMDSRKEPYVIHYAGPEKPWNNSEMDMADDFWKYSRMTSYYDEMLQNSVEKMSQKQEVDIGSLLYEKVVGTIYIVLVRLHIIKRY